MRRRHSLRFRVAIAFAGLGAVLSLLFTLGIWLAAHDVANRLMDETLEAELADYMSRRSRNPNSLPPATASTNGYLIRHGETAAGLPAGIVGLPPGRHEIILNDIPHRVAVAERDGDRYVLVFNETHQKRREQRFLAYLIAGAALMTLLSSIGGLWLAGRVIAPLTDLAKAVRAADFEKPPRLVRSPGPGDEIDELAHAFDHYLARLAAFIERERNFAADASHELRTPLATMRGAAEVLADDPGLSKAQHRRVARILRAAEDMGELIAAILLLAREEGVPVDAPCDAGHLAQTCIERYRSLAATHNTHIDLDLAEEVCLTVPPAFFAIVIANLLQNAVAHTCDGRISVRLDRQRLVVSDTGSGIPSADLAHVFERNFRGPASTGSGIGLSLVKRICERIGWAISLSSQPTGGTTAILEFPS